MANEAVGRGLVEGLQFMGKLVAQLVEMGMNKKRVESLEKENKELKDGMAGKVAEKMGMWKQVGNEFLADNFVGEWKTDPANPDKQVYELTKGDDGMAILKHDAKDLESFVKLTQKVNEELNGVVDKPERTKIVDRNLKDFTEKMLIPRLEREYQNRGMSKEEAKIAAKAEAEQHPWINQIKKSVKEKAEQQEAEIKFGQEKKLNIGDRE